MSDTEELLKERIFSLQRHKEEAEQVKYELQLSVQRLAAENVKLKERLAGCRATEQQLHKQAYCKDDEIAALQRHVSDLASTNARLQRKQALSSGDVHSGTAVSNLKRLISEWFHDFRKKTKTTAVGANETSAALSPAAEAHYHALLAALVSVLQVCQKDVESLSPTPVYTDLLRRALYAGQLQCSMQPAPAMPGAPQASLAAASAGEAAPLAAPAAAAGSHKDEGAGAGAGAGTSGSTGSQPASTSQPMAPLMQALGDRPLPRREGGAGSVWGYLFGAAGSQDDFALSDINNAESTHVLPV